MQFAETGEVGVVEQQLTGLVHQRVVQFCSYLAGVSAAEGIFLFADVVFVSSGSGVEPCIGVIPYRQHLLHGNVPW